MARFFHHGEGAGAAGLLPPPPVRAPTLARTPARARVIMSAEETLADASTETIEATAAVERVVASFASGAPPPLAALASAADLAGVPLPAIAACVLVVATVLFWLIARLVFGSRRSRGGSGGPTHSETRQAGERIVSGWRVAWWTGRRIRRPLRAAHRRQARVL